MPNFSGMWTLQAQMQAVSQGTWTDIVLPYGKLYAWGYNAYGQLGQNDSVSRSSPVQVGSENTWLTVAGAYQTLIATKTNNTFWALGRNSGGQLGQGDTANRSSPVQVGALTDWSVISGGVDHITSVKTDGTLWSWGDNYYGQLGQNIAYTINRSSPVQVGALTLSLIHI